MDQKCYEPITMVVGKSWFPNVINIVGHVTTEDWEGSISHTLTIWVDERAIDYKEKI